MRASVRARSDPAVMMALRRQEISAMDPDVPVTNIRTMDEILARNRWPQRIFGTMFLVFAIIAIVVAAVGLYSVTAYSVAQRTQEIDIRTAHDELGRVHRLNVASMILAT